MSLLSRETGASFGFGMFQMHFVPGLFRQTAALAYAPVGEVLPSDNPGTFAMGLRQPVGVVAAIAPWNAALILSARSIAAPLALGNTVVLKPSEESPLVGGLLWGEIFEEAGLPPGVLNIVTHAREQAVEIGDELVSHPKVRRINFTGSTAVGRIIAEAAGRHLKRVVLELGGSAPLIVLGDADVDYAVNAAAFGAFMHQGQICMSSRRIIVERPIADAFIDGLVAQDEGAQGRRPERARHGHRPADQRGRAEHRQGPRRQGRRRRRAGAGRRRGRRGLLPGDAARRTSRPTRSSRRSRRSGPWRRSRSSRARRTP